ncbi:ATP-binding protein [Pseudarthrobacter equi]|uniref:ATP-binding protein n=1 Tax=Pseudarthrobacter equi TaxID=728066 RepID=UPI0021BF722E|nr:ATP-binding protein [Pseudarthrobacter equi]MCT9625789.1 ATP-binding protein [Pseudarthrobacter equi]
MTTEHILPPDPHLMESMRAVGYTLQTAVADLIDNSIAANATEVSIFFGNEPSPYVALVDNGEGMTAGEAVQAMRLAGASPMKTRKANDLGRFGLGLKTASLSQCRDLVVVSKQNGVVCGFEWNIDHMIERQTWSLIVLSEEEVEQLPRFGELATLASGTLVIWRDLDRLESVVGDFGSSLDAAMMDVRDHLALVFHRFLAGEHGQRFNILLNRVPIQGSDPFLESNKATQVGPSESFAVAGERVEIQPYTLPHLNRMTAAEKKRAQIAGRVRDSQGFYIYRGKRLVIWGTWFRIAPKDDLGKLARVKVDIPNSLDHLWALDIKKASAAPPPQIRDNLRRIAGRIIEPSKRVHLYRGRIVQEQSSTSPLWNVIDDRGTFRYEINRLHPALAILTNQMNPADVAQISSVLSLLEATFPVEDAYNRLSQDESHSPIEPPRPELEDLAAALWKAHKASGGDPEQFVSAMASIEPFALVPAPIELLKKVVND